MVRRQELGQVLLETALVIPVALGIALAAVDVNHALRTRAALKEGARTALRCLYTTDGACTSAGTNDFVPIFDVYQTTVTPNYVTPLYGFKGTTRYIQAPQFEASFSATILNRGFTTLEYFRHQLEQRRYPAEAAVKTNVLYALYPYVTGSSPSGAKLVWKNRKNKTYPPTIDRSISSVSGSVTNGNQHKTIGRISFSIKSPFKKNIKGCQLSNNFNTPKKNKPNFNKACSNRKDYSKSHANIVIHLTGDVQGSTDGTKGAIRMYLEDSGGRTIKDLGGREMIPSPGFRDGSLVPRGVPSQYNDGLNYWEVTGHSPIRIKYGETYYIRLAIEYRADSGDGEFRWRGNRLRIYSPQAGVADGGVIPCDHYLLPSEEGNRAACKNPPVQGMGKPKISDWNTYQTDFSTSSESPDQHPNLSEILGDLKVLASAQDMSVTSEGPFTVETTFNCPGYDQPGSSGAINTGVPDSPKDGFIQQSSLASSICPPEYDQTRYALRDVKWNERKITLSAPEPIVWTRRNCEETNIPEKQIPQEFTKFYKLHISQKPSGYAQEPIHTGPGFDEEHDPRRIINRDRRYNCTDMGLPFRIAEESLPTVEQLKHLPANSFFKNFHAAPIRCERQWKRLVVKKAVSELGLPDNAYLDPEFTGPHGEDFLTESPKNRCYEWKSTAGTSGKEQYLGKFPLNELPAVCNDGEHHCRLNLTGFEGENTGSGPIADFEKAARDYGQKEIQALNPRARFECDDTDCVQLNLSSDNEHFEAHAQTKISLYTLGGLEVPIDYSEKQRWEGFLSR